LKYEKEKEEKEIRIESREKNEMIKERNSNLKKNGKSDKG
jgi:hypothetical protein